MALDIRSSKVERAVTKEEFDDIKTATDNHMGDKQMDDWAQRENPLAYFQRMQKERVVMDELVIDNAIKALKKVLDIHENRLSTMGLGKIDAVISRLNKLKRDGFK